MPHDHTIKAGDHVVRLAYRSGHRTVDAVWQHPVNETLRAGRPDPAVLALGDVIHVPDAEPRVFKNLQTRREHELVVHLPIPRLRLVLLRASGVPYAGLQCLVLFDDEALRPTTDEHGCVEFDIDPSTTLVTISFDLEALEIGVAHLQPVDVLAGCCARLENLGYRPGGCHGDAPADPYALRSAVEEFQCNQGLPVDGELSDATRAKLLDVHGA